MRTRSLFASTALWAAVTAGVVAGCEEDDSVLQQPLPLVTAAVAIPPGAECPFGGVQLSSGPDKNGNGILDPGEIEQTTEMCKPSSQPVDPPATLLRSDAEPPGPNCFRGGTAVRSGPDLNRDGALEDDEIVATTYACTVSDRFDGDFTSAMWGDPAAVVALGQARAVTGNLTINSDAAVSLPALELVGGSITVSRAGTPAGFDAPALAQVGGNLTANGAGFSGELALPALARVGGDIAITDPTLPGFRAPQLTGVGGTLTLRAAALTALDLRGLRVAGGLVLVDLAVTSLELPALTSVLGELAFARLPIAQLDLSALRVIGDDLTMSELPQLGVIDLPVLAEAGHLFLTSVNARSILVPALTTVDGDLWFVDGDVLDVLVLPALTRIGGSLAVARCPSFEFLEAPVLDAVGEFDDESFSILFDALDLQRLSMPRLRIAPGGLQVTSAFSLSGLELPALTRASRLQFQGDAQLASLALPALASLDSAVLDAPALRDLALGALTTVSGRLEIRNTQLVDLHGLASLRAVGDRPAALANLVIDGNARLTSLAGLDQLAAITGKLTLTNDATLASLAGLANLTKVGGAVTVTGDPALSPDDIAALIARVHP